MNDPLYNQARRWMSTYWDQINGSSTDTMLLAKLLKRVDKKARRDGFSEGLKKAEDCLVLMTHMEKQRNEEA